VTSHGWQKTSVSCLPTLRCEIEGGVAEKSVWS
jgi:hypothetical protein